MGSGVSHNSVYVSLVVVSCCDLSTSWHGIALVSSEAVVYNEVHLMYAGAMAATASGIAMEMLFERFVFEPGEHIAIELCCCGVPITMCRGRD